VTCAQRGGKAEEKIVPGLLRMSKRFTNLPATNIALEFTRLASDFDLRFSPWNPSPSEARRFKALFTLGLRRDECQWRFFADRADRVRCVYDAAEQAKFAGKGVPKYVLLALPQNLKFKYPAARLCPDKAHMAELRTISWENAASCM
jgi:hypothetical protein